MKPWIGCTAGVFLALAASSASAQTLTGAIAGIVKDPQGGALPGATISLLGRTGTASATTDARGEYRFPAIEPGAYSLRVEMPGFRPQQREKIGIHVGESLTIDFLLSIGGLTDEIEVLASAPLVDVRSSSFRIGLTQDQLFNIPLTRDVQDLADATPGINRGSAFGANENSNALYLDGVDTRDPERGGGSLFMNYNLLEEVQVQGPGAPAEYSAFTGAVVNTVTRSGGNRFAGLFEARYSARGLAADNVDAALTARNPALGDPGITTRLLDLTGQFSGPIVRDKLFFLVNAQRTERETDPSGPRSFDELRSYRWNGKLVWDPRPQDHATLSLQHGTVSALGGGTPTDTDETTLNTRLPETGWNLQWRRLFGPRTFLEARYLGWAGTERTSPTVDVPAHFDYVTGLKTGSAGFGLRVERVRHQANISVSHYAELFGHHDLKFGVEIGRGRLHNRLALTGGLYYVDQAGQPYLAYSFGFDVRGGAGREGVYAQDGWRATDRLTLNVGCRLDRYRGDDDGRAVYRARGLAPRLGFAFDLGSDHRAVLRASFGRYYDSLSVSYFYTSLHGFDDGVLYANTDSGLIEIGRQTQAAATVDPDIRHPRVDEFALGFERALGKDVRFSVTGIARRSIDFIDAVHPDARFVPVATTNPLTGQPLTVYRMADPTVLDEAAFITNVDGLRYLDPRGELLGATEAFRKYRGLMIVASRRLAGRWQAQASYVLAKAEGTVDNGPYGGLIPFEVGALNFDSANDAIVNAEGRLPNDFRHELKVLASYRVPRLELGLSALFRVLGGTTYTPVQVLAPPTARDRGTVRLEPRGSRRLPTQAVLDLRFEKTIGVRRGRFGLYADLTNAFNASTPTGAQDRVPSQSVAGREVLFGAPVAIVPSRQAMLGARWSF